jgi:hypothetical protein
MTNVQTKWVRLNPHLVGLPGLIVKGPNRLDFKMPIPNKTCDFCMFNAGKLSDEQEHYFADKKYLFSKRDVSFGTVE